ncbi:MAG TPA: YkgJ family cysteine cluster protein, partial [Polyangiaceae bacterium]|nr:YkgJ family cysteine cluster protein [Polyangiaceae bacterium]
RVAREGSTWPIAGLKLPVVGDVPECLACGSCCFSQLEAYVRVTGDDYSRLGERAAELVWFDGIRAYLRMVDGHCAALQLDPESGQLVCDAYAVRPQVCRDLARGSAECRAEREMKSERPLLALRRSAFAR